MITSTSHQTQTVGQQRPSGGLITTILLMLVLNTQASIYNVQINENEFMAFFDGKRCITGHLAVAPNNPIIMQDNHVSSTETTESNQKNEPSSQQQTGNSNSDVPNMEKEKTPMCLVNELARFNKIEHQYRLTNEEGPPHKKKFTVTLKFGTEEYTADGASIKKAQHAAASKALKTTLYDHPPPKTSRNQRGTKGNITPTVELNALAMKRGEPTTYTLVESPQYSEQYNGFVTYHSHRGMYTQAYNNHYTYGYGRGKPHYRGGYVDPRFYGGKPPLYKVVVKVGERAFTGEGVTAQAARHDAASKALQVLLSLPIEECQARTNCTEGFVDSDSSAEVKSPISLVHEIALKRNLHVHFEVIGEKGQPHMRTFVTRCCVGETFESIGEGNGKKVSKKRAAEKMLELLRTLPPTTSVTAAGCVGSLGRIKKKSNSSKKKSRNLIKDTNSVGTTEQKYEAEPVEEMNPISRLMQIQQAKREKEPVYILMEERGVPRRREFVMEVKMGEHSFIGSGPNKKIAKRNAAEGLLQQLGYSSSTVTRSGHPLPNNKQVRFSDEKTTSSSSGGSVGRQLVPGLLLMNDNKATNGNQHTPHKGVNIKTTATIAKEYLNNGNSPTADALAGHKGAKRSSAVRPTEQLQYLAQVLNFRVQFSDFPKGNHTEYLSLVSLDTDPPQVCHGSGTTTELSHDQAALNALRSLSEMGLDSIAPAKKDTQTTSIPPVTHPADNLYINLGNSLTNEDTYVNGK